MINKYFVFILKFFLILCYFFGNKQKAIFLFYIEIDNEIKRQNTTIIAYCSAFINKRRIIW